MSARPLRLVASGVGVTLAGRPIVENAAIGLRVGELAMLVGPNGAGKTTLVRALAGLVASTGDIRVDGVPLASLSRHRRARRIAYLPQGHVFHWPVSVAQIVALGRQPHADAFGRLSSKDREAVGRALAVTGLEDFAGRAIETLSGGERARVAVARALASEAPILLADEPTASLDIRHQLMVMELLREVARGGAAVLAIGHDLSLAARYADRVAIMAAGRIVADDDAAQALTPARIARAFGVAAHRIETPSGPAIVSGPALDEPR